MALNPARELNAKHCVVAALTATFVTAVITTVVFVVLSSAHIHFSVVRADHHFSSDGRVDLSLALSVDNPSRRAAVRYQSMYVDVSSEMSTDFLSANLMTGMPMRQPTRNLTTIGASLSLEWGPRLEAFTGNLTSNLDVTVTAVAQFKVGITWTRLYDLKISCSPIDFFSATGRRRRRRRSQSSAVGLPVVCRTMLT